MKTILPNLNSRQLTIMDSRNSRTRLSWLPTSTRRRSWVKCGSSDTVHRKPDDLVWDCGRLVCLSYFGAYVRSCQVLLTNSSPKEAFPAKYWMIRTVTVVRDNAERAKERNSHKLKSIPWCLVPCRKLYLAKVLLTNFRTCVSFGSETC